MTNPINDEFNNASGSFPNYDVYDLTQKTQLLQQEHIDIRSFFPTITRSMTMAQLDLMTMTMLDADTQSVLEGSTAVRQGEVWTAGVVAKQADRNHWYGISLTCTAGTNTTSSTIPNISSTGLMSVDISALDPTDFITVALPVFPLASITTGSSFIDFTSNVDGNFTTGPTDSVAFSASTVALGSGNSELRFPISALATIDLAAITGVRFRIQATGNCTFRCLAIRAVSSDWELAPIDLNTLTDQIITPVSLDGSATATWTFPTATAPITPTEWPVLYRSNDVAGNVDPRPIDLRVSTVFNLGSLVNATGNNYSTIVLRFRELGLDEYTQLDLDGGTFTQDTLNNLGHQPDFGRALYISRTQVDLELQNQGQLNGETQFDLERIQDFLSAAFVEVKLQVISGQTILSIQNADGIGYSFSDLVLAPNTDYILFADVVDSLVQVKIYTLDSQGNIDLTSVYDTTAVIDDSFVHRRKGRFGWYAQLRDGDAYISNIRTRSANYAEYKSVPFRSETPVEGARLNIAKSADKRLITGLGPKDSLAILDNSKSDSGRAYKITTSNPLQGIITNIFQLDDFAQSEIRFNLLFPSNDEPVAFLKGELGRTIPLYLPPIIPDRWQTITIDLSTLEDEIQTGPYQFILAQLTGGNTITWYLDNLEGTTRVVACDGSGKASDAWRMNQQAWTPFRDTTNEDNDGILFSERGTTMQIRARALHQDAAIQSLKIRPKYAQLGRFVWSDQQPQGTLAPGIPTAVVTPSTRTVACNGSSSTPPSGRPIIQYLWTFGDGTFDYGPIINHTYVHSGNYVVTLTIIDAYGIRASTSKAVTV